jgi:hypothetical protein
MTIPRIINKTVDYYSVGANFFYENEQYNLLL